MKFPTHLALAIIAPFLLSLPAEAGPTLERIVADGKIRLGVRTDAPPFSSLQNDTPSGFSVDLCVLMAEAIVITSGMDGLKGTLVSVDTEDRFDSLQNGEIDVLCGATTATLKRREKVNFTISTFATGVGAVVQSDASDLVKEVLVTSGPAALSKAAVGEALGGKVLGVRANTTASEWLNDGPISKIDGVTVQTFSDHADGLEAVSSGQIAAYFADRAILAGQIRNSDHKADLLVSKTQFTHEPYALAIPKGDEELRLLLDKALSYLYRNGAIFKIYEAHFGKPSAEALLFYTMTALPD